MVSYIELSPFICPEKLAWNYLFNSKLENFGKKTTRPCLMMGRAVDISFFISGKYVIAK